MNHSCTISEPARCFRAVAKFAALLALAFPPFTVSASAFGADWQATVGAQSQDKGHQVVAFLPNELWIHAGDSVQWTVNVDEIHTITFLKDGQVRLPFALGCTGNPQNPGYSFVAAVVDGSTCISTPPMTSGQTFTVTFPSQGNFKLVCLVHQDMTGVVHVLDPAAPLPHDQSFYDQEAADEAQALLVELDQGSAHQHSGPNSIAVGGGETLANGGGHNTISLMRFVQPELTIHAGGTVEWTNADPSLPHTITFGTEPGNPIPPSANVSFDTDGALHATINSTSDSVHSGFIVSAPQDQAFRPQTPLGTTRFRVTFTNPGVYPYICALHDTLGMKGTILVLP